MKPTLLPLIVPLPCDIGSMDTFRDWLAQNGFEVARNSHLPDTLEELAKATAKPDGCLVFFEALVNGSPDDSPRGFKLVQSYEPHLARFVDQMSIGLDFEINPLKEGQRVLVWRARAA